jgi:hypothetical protein
MRTVAQALAAAKYQVAHPNATVRRGGLCLAFVRQCWGLAPTGVPDADAAWARAKHKTKYGTPPAGAPVYWAIGQHGHIAISAGNNRCYSTDILHNGRVSLVPLVQIDSKWGAHYRGWSSDAWGGVALPLTAAVKPTGYQPFPGTAWFKKNPHSAIITRMGKRLVAEHCGKYKDGPGPQWTSTDRASYKAWQQHLGYHGADADGWPGKVTWDKLKVPRA